jgi:predicted metal-binding protein
LRNKSNPIEKGTVMHDKKPKKIKTFTAQEIRKDIERYRRRAVELGATDAKMIPAQKVYVDPRVRMKCIVPKCTSYNTCAHCPPHSIGPEVIGPLVSAFKYALLVKREIPGDLVTGPGYMDTDKNGNPVPTKKLKELLGAYRLVSDIVTQIESDAFYDGHYHAVAFAGGSCRIIYCNFQDCLLLQGKECRFPLRSRPSMEGSSIDVYRTVTEAGWDIYPIGVDCDPANVPCGSLVGIVLIE